MEDTEVIFLEKGKTDKFLETGIMKEKDKRYIIN